MLRLQTQCLARTLEETIDGGHRALVFSQFAAMLDLVAAALEQAGILFCRLDG
jgi:SNF2 family DNA or RNA helicase